MKWLQREHWWRTNYITKLQFSRKVIALKGTVNAYVFDFQFSNSCFNFSSSSCSVPYGLRIQEIRTIAIRSMLSNWSCWVTIGVRGSCAGPAEQIRTPNPRKSTTEAEASWRGSLKWRWRGCRSLWAVGLMWVQDNLMAWIERGQVWTREIRLGYDSRERG